MLGINEVIVNLVMNISLTEKQKKRILKAKGINYFVLEYLKEKFGNLTIKLNNDDEVSLFSLMENEKLMTTCFQTSETIAAFLNDDDKVERGYISRGISSHSNYNHSWVTFKFDNKEYVLDACLNVLCTKEDYYKLFKPNIYATVSAKDIKDELIRQFSMPHEIDESKFDENGISYDIGMWDNGCTCLVTRKKDEIDIEGSENREDPLYGNWSSYIADVKDNDIKKLVFHHYKNPCSY